MMHLRIRRASISRAAVLRRSERTRFSSASDDEVGGDQRDARAKERQYSMPGNSQRKGAVRRKGKSNTARVRGAGPPRPGGSRADPKAEDREYHAKHQAKKFADRRTSTRPPGPRTGRPGTGPEWVVGRNPVLEALEAEIPVKSAYVAEGAERDDRLREILKLAANRSIALLEVTRNEMDRLTGGAVHQGVACSCRPSSTRTPTTCWPPRWGRHRAADGRAGLDHRPTQSRRDRPVGCGFRGPRRTDPGAPFGRNDGRRLEDLRRRGGPDPDCPRHESEPDAARVRRRRSDLVGLDGRATTDLGEVDSSAAGPGGRQRG